MVELYYIVGVIFFMVYYPRVLTRHTCFGKNGDQLIVKTKKGYYLVYSLYTIFFGILCYEAGVSVSISPLDKVDYFLRMQFSDSEYFYDQEDTIKENADIYYIPISTSGKELVELLERIVKNDTYYCQWYQLKNFYIKYGIGSGTYLLINDGFSYGNAVVERNGLLKKVSYRWDNEKLEQREGF